jgi:FAD:protein FMN transferase
MVLRSEALGAHLVLEIADLERGAASSALEAALEAVREVESLLDGDPPGGIEVGTGWQAVPPPLFELIARAHQFCAWSDGLHGPLAGHLYSIWGLHEPAAALPTEEQRTAAAEQARCDRLALDADQGRVSLAAGARLELRGFAQGFAVDRAIATLQAAGSAAASVTLGPVQRAIGSSPEGPGWPVRVPLPGHLEPWLAGALLVDQALAVASATFEGLRAGGERFAPYLDQRLGSPVAGVFATAAVSGLALDAEGVAITAFVTGNRRGSHLLGQLRPAPAVLWLLGSGEGQPLAMDFRWSAAGLRSRGGS